MLKDKYRLLGPKVFTCLLELFWVTSISRAMFTEILVFPIVNLGPRIPRNYAF